MVLPRAVSCVGRCCHPLERNPFCFNGICQVRCVAKRQHAKERGRRNYKRTSPIAVADWLNLRLYLMLTAPERTAGANILKSCIGETGTSGFSVAQLVLPSSTNPVGIPILRNKVVR